MEYYAGLKIGGSVFFNLKKISNMSLVKKAGYNNMSNVIST